MPNIHTPCPFCDKKPVQTHWLKHILSCHLELLFSPTTPYGKKNLSMLQAPKARYMPPTLYFPKDEQRLCCLGCKLTFNKMFYAKSHFPKCGAAHLQQTKDMLAEMPTLQTQNTQSTVPPERLKEPEEAESKNTTLALIKIIRGLRADVSDAKYWEWWYEKLNEDGSLSKLKEAYEDKQPGGWDVPKEEYEVSLDECFPNEMKMLNLTGEELLARAKAKYLPLEPPQ